MTAPKKIGLFFGSFNPVHTGHMIIANYMATQTDLSEVWLVVTPHNPLKKRENLLSDTDRLTMVELAVGNRDNLRASNIEFALPKPSYTIDTLAHLSEKYPKKKFVILMGGDNLATLEKWKNYDQILQNYEIYVYKRPNVENGPFHDHPSVKFFHAPQLELSSTYIRSCIETQKSISYLVPESVEKYIDQHHLYKK